MLTSGRKLDNRYLIREEIGSGGFGAVYLAEDTRFTGKNLVAIKKIAQNNEQTAKAFRHEANLLYNLSHPNLPKVTNCFQEDEANFIVMDFIAGEDLMTRLKRGKKFSVAEVLEISDKVLDALEYLHSFLIFHRDIKPHNIKIDENGKIFLLDFGTAKGNLDDTTLSLTDQSITGYTPFYAPLEQVLRVDANSYLLMQSIGSPNLEKFVQNKTDARSDIYSLGATVYHLLTGFSLERATATVRAHLIWSGKPDPLPDCRTINSEIPAPFAAIINKCLEIEPENRFQTAAELRAALKNLQFAASDLEKPTKDFEPVFQTQPAPPAINTQPENAPSASVPTLFRKADLPTQKAKSRLGAYLGLLGLLLILASAGGWLAWRSFGSSPIQTPPAAENKPSVNSQILSYSLLVQKMRDGVKFQEPFESSGQEIFESGYQFQMRITPPGAGYLYAFAEGLDAQGEKIFTIAFPTPQRNNGSANVAANQNYESGWNEFSGTAGTENFWIIWSQEKNEIAENARANAFENAGKLTDESLKNKLKDFLENESKNKKIVTKDTDKKLSKVDFETNSLAHLIQLEHR